MYGLISVSGQQKKEITYLTKKRGESIIFKRERKKAGKERRNSHGLLISKLIGL